jgi:hypothetical protein
MKSRRGGRRRAQGNPSIPAEAVSTQGTEQSCQVGLSTPPITQSTIGSHDSLASSHSNSPGSHFEPWEEDGHAIPDRLITLFYRFFHSSHPCALPYKFLQPYRSSNSPGIELLVTVMQYIGSLYTQKVASEPWREQVEVSIRSLPPHSSLFEVQALTLYAITAQWTNYKDYAHTLLNLAIDRALSIGLYDGDFATRNAAKRSVYAESCRRTWWNLYLTELSMAAIDRKGATRLNNRLVTCSVDLPCFEEDYEAGVCPSFARCRDIR